MSQRNLLLLAVATAFCFVCFVRAERSPYARYVAAGYSMIDRWALNEPPDRELFNGAMQGMVDILEKQGDEHSQFIESQRANTFQEEILQEFAGVGIMLSLLGDPPLPVVIAPPLPGTPAFSAGIRRGDRIVAVDGKSTEGMDLPSIVRMVRGPEDAVVTLTIRYGSEDKLRDAPLKRAIITIESILGDYRDDQGQWNFHVADHPDIGYVRITKFGDKTVDEFQTVLAKLVKENISGLVLDVRDNFGGSLDAAIDVCDMFLPVGQTIVSIRGRRQQLQDRYESTGNGRYQQLPLVVLVNHNSASASEIVAACLQDHQRAAIVGQRSYGKGTVQRLLPIESGRSRLKLTTATYWRPNGKNIHRMPDTDETAEWGVSPSDDLAIDFSEQQHRQWQVYRSRRDLGGLAGVPPEELPLNLTEEELPEDFADQVLQRAVEFLRSSPPAQEEQLAPPAAAAAT